ncbi:MAG: hypothetical protein ACUZ8I_06890, partial [Candidatus Scalindua sp.]
LAAQVGSSRVDVELDTRGKSPVRTRQIAYRHDVKPTTKKVKGNGGHAPEALIPMGENRIVEHEGDFKNF